MKKIIASFLLCLLSLYTNAQITITAADMPVASDMLRSSAANPLNAGVSLTNTGINHVWDFSNLVPISQNIDTYKTALQVNIIYAATISVTAYGIKTVNLPLPPNSPISITDAYTFFNKKTNPSRFIAEGFAANISGLPTPMTYNNEDTIFVFPLTYNNNKVDTSTYFLTKSIAGLGTLLQKGSRYTSVDGWGTIKTPYFTTPVNCIRVKSELQEVDTITFAGSSFPITRHTVDYRWLVNGSHYSALWVTSNISNTGNETISTIRYKDSVRNLGLSNPITSAMHLIVFPNPSIDGNFKIQVPTSWSQYTIEVFDILGKIISTVQNENSINIENLPAGRYLLKATNGIEIGYSMLEK